MMPARLFLRHISNSLLVDFFDTKAGLNYDIPQGKQKGDLSRPLLGGGGYQYVDEDAVRLDLDDLAGEVVSSMPAS